MTHSVQDEQESATNEKGRRKKNRGISPLSINKSLDINRERIVRYSSNENGYVPVTLSKEWEQKGGKKRSRFGNKLDHNVISLSSGRCGEAMPWWHVCVFGWYRCHLPVECYATLKLHSWKYNITCMAWRRRRKLREIFPVMFLDNYIHFIIWMHKLFSYTNKHVYLCKYYKL